MRQDTEQVVEDIWGRVSEAILLVRKEVVLVEDDKRFLLGFIIENNLSFARENPFDESSVNALATMVLAGEARISLEDIYKESALLMDFLILDILSCSISMERMEAASLRLAFFILFFLVEPDKFGEKYSGLRMNLN